MASNGIIIVAIISIKTRFRPLNLNFAKPYPVMDDRMTVKKDTLTATIKELRVFLTKIKSPSGPRRPFQKFSQ